VQTELNSKNSRASFSEKDACGENRIYSTKEIGKAYQQAEKYTRNHYENFPVVSFLIPGKLRKHVAIIYWFARTADDIADEGNLSKAARLEKLNNFEFELKCSLNGNVQDEFFLALVNTIKEKELTLNYFYDLLSAFKQDVIKKRYENFDEVLDYCSRSANPVGRIILELFGIKNDNANKYSDCICTALQLTNFLQDTTVDYKKGRIYLPQNEMIKFSVSEKLFEQNKNNDNLMQLVQYNVQRVQEFFNEGKNLLNFLKGRLKYEIGWTVTGGEEILEQIRKNNYNVLGFRPKLSKAKLVLMFLKSFRIF
jgi:squalene synthase HpnC